VANRNFKTAKENNISDDEVVRGMEELEVDLIDIEYSDVEMNIDLKDM